MNFSSKQRGLYIAVAVIILWAALLSFCLLKGGPIFSTVNFVLVLCLTHLYTGLFITAHDSFHGTVSTNKKLNQTIGILCIFLYAAFDYKKLDKEHKKHHAHATTDDDPDFYKGGIIRWYLNFILHYVSWLQLFMLAVIFNLIHYFLGIPKSNIVLFWIIPPILSTMQLFYFGTYQPHRNPESIGNPHRTRSQSKNHVWGFISCYFFGYHLEHHSKPHVPWWKLWTEK